MQKWKTDATLHSCDRLTKNGQEIKNLPYGTVYKSQFLEQDPLMDWDSIARCIKVWLFAIRKLKDINTTKWSVLDCGTKDGQFTMHLQPLVKKVIGVEYSDMYVEYCKKRNRPVIKGDVCDLDFKDNTFDFVFAHHVLGLTSDYKKAIQEMYRVTKNGMYGLHLNQIPGNKRKHYSYVESKDILKKWYDEKWFKGKLIYFDYLDNEYNNEFLVIYQKIKKVSTKTIKTGSKIK